MASSCAGGVLAWAGQAAACLRPPPRYLHLQSAAWQVAAACNLVRVVLSTAVVFGGRVFSGRAGAASASQAVAGRSRAVAAYSAEKAGFFASHFGANQGRSPAIEGPEI